MPGRVALDLQNAPERGHLRWHEFTIELSWNRRKCSRGLGVEQKFLLLYGADFRPIWNVVLMTNRRARCGPCLSFSTSAKGEL